MEPGDLVAIIRASGGMGALQQFTADKRQLRAAVDRIRWNPQSDRIGVFKPISDNSMQSIMKGTIRDDIRKERFESESTDFREQLFYHRNARCAELRCSRIARAAGTQIGNALLGGLHAWESRCRAERQLWAVHESHTSFHESAD